jgi:hypothetical protein
METNNFERQRKQKLENIQPSGTWDQLELCLILPIKSEGQANTWIYMAASFIGLFNSSVFLIKRCLRILTKAIQWFRTASNKKLV